jgi:peptidoglycan/LPS O-acetylase OafA/YrhL
MKIHNLKQHIVTIFLIGLLAAPILSILLALGGLGIYSLTGNQGAALWICGIAFGASVLLAPIAFWMFSKPRTRFIVEKLDVGSS